MHHLCETVSLFQGLFYLAWATLIVFKILKAEYSTFQREDARQMLHSDTGFESIQKTRNGEFAKCTKRNY